MRIANIQGGIRMDKKVEGFVCPICRSREYEAKFREPAVFGGRNSIEYYICKGCSVLFQDPVKFSKPNGQ